MIYILHYIIHVCDWSELTEIREK